MRPIRFKKTILGIVLAGMIGPGCIVTPAPAPAPYQAPPPEPYQAPPPAHAEIVIEVEPPAPRPERIPRARRGYVWVPGYWAWEPRYRRYDWVPGHWERARRGATYVPGHWERRPRGWIYVPGHWR